MHFDPRAAKQLIAGQHLLVAGCQGLRLEGSATRKSWTYRYKDVAGKMKQVKLGEWPSMSLGQATAAWQELREKRGGGIDPVASKREQAAGKMHESVKTVGQLLSRFCDHLDRIRQQQSAKAARATLGEMLSQEPLFANSPPAGVDRARAYAILDARREFPMAAKKMRALLGQAWDWGLDAGLIPKDTMNWWRMVLKGQLKSKGKIIDGKHVGAKRRVLTRSELRVLLPWAHANMPDNQRDATLLYLYTGMRGAEIFSLRKEFCRVEDDVMWVTFPAHLLKMERDSDTVDHRVPLVGVAREIVERRIENAWDGWLFFTKNGKPRQYGRSTFSTYVYGLMPGSEKVKRRTSEGLICPVTDWSPHALRRTARTLLSAIDCPEDVGEAILGHKQAVMVASYNLHTYDEQKLVWLPRLAELVDGLGGRPG